MLDLYVTSTNDTSFLPRALELSEVEMAWWDTNRTIEVTSGNNSYSMHAYNVTNSAPRPEVGEIVQICLTGVELYDIVELPRRLGD